MGLFISERARRDGRVTVAQLVSSMMMFVALSIIGGFLLAGLALPVATVAASAAEGTAELFEELPRSLQNASLPQASNIYARDGETLLATFYSQNRVVVPLERISPWMQIAVVAVEDKRFFLHNGVDGEGLLRAAYINLTTPDTPGASTLTQQLVKNTLLQNAQDSGDPDAIQDAIEVSMTRKIREMRLALAFEENVNREYGQVCTANPEVDCGKEKILEQYLNIAQFGTRIYGVEAAAQFYFKKPAAELTAIEAATIAGITQNPSRWDPVRNPENAQIRRNTVLLVMYEQGYINRAEYDQYRTTPIEDTLTLNYPRFSCSAAQDAPFFCDYITKIISRHPVFNDPDLPWTGTELLYRGGLTIVTTLDVDMQRIANSELENSLPSDDPSGMAMALVTLDTETGQILAMAQNRVFDPTAEEPNSTSINYSVDRSYGGSRGFSPGSVFKPVLLAEWLNSGRSLNQVVSGEIREWEASSWRAACLGRSPFTGQPWAPTNVLGASAGQQTVISATANSVNTSYVAMTNQLDLCAIRDMATTLGFKRSDGIEFEVVPSATLGTQNASPLTMASTYQTFANRGVHCEPIAILSITDADGESIAVPQEDCRRVITEELSDGVTHALRAVMTEGSGRRHQLERRVSAGKTGTSQRNAHTWFAGYTPELTTLVWLGHPDRDVPQQDITLNGQYYRYVYGSTLALPTWKRFMDQALRGVSASSMPTASAAMLNGVPLRVPNVVGLTEEEGQNLINDAGFTFQISDFVLFSDAYEPGTIVSQTPDPDSTMNGGDTVTYVIATNTRPAWWTDWPANWDPFEAPADWWGSTWPPAEFATNPPTGWSIEPDEPDEPEDPEDPEPPPGPDE